MGEEKETPDRTEVRREWAKIESLHTAEPHTDGRVSLGRVRRRAMKSPNPRGPQDLKERPQLKVSMSFYRLAGAVDYEADEVGTVRRIRGGRKAFRSGELACPSSRHRLGCLLNTPVPQAHSPTLGSLIVYRACVFVKAHSYLDLWSLLQILRAYWRSSLHGNGLDLKRPFCLYAAQPYASSQPLPTLDGPQFRRGSPSPSHFSPNHNPILSNVLCIPSHALLLLLPFEYRYICVLVYYLLSFCNVLHNSLGPNACILTKPS